MKNSQYDILFRQVILPAILETRKSGGEEYARSEDNIFANFERISDALDISVEECIMVYAMKHLDGIVAHVQGTTSQREDVRGRITDLMVYMTLLWAYLVKDESIEKDKVIQKSEEMEYTIDQSEKIVMKPEERQAMNKEASKRFKNAPDFNPDDKEWEASWNNPPSWDGDYNNMPEDLKIQKVGRFNKNALNSDGSSKCCGGKSKAQFKGNNLKEHLKNEKEAKKDKKISE